MAAASGHYEEDKILCGLCDNSDDSPLAKCVDCDLLMCKLCTKSHSRIKLTSDHNIVMADHQAPLQLSPSKSSTILCVIHSDEEVQFFCHTCNMCICSECITGNHSNHKCAVIKHAAIELADTIRDKLALFKENKMDVLQLKIEKIKELQAKNTSNSTSNQQNIQTRTQDLVREINKTGNDLIQISEATTKQNEQYLSNIHKNMTEEFTDMKILCEKYNQQLTSKSDIEKVDAWIHMVSAKTRFKSHDEEIKVDLPKFFFCKTEISEIKLLFGSLEADEERGSDFDIEPTDVSPGSETVSTNDNITDTKVNDKTQKSESKPPNTSKAEPTDVSPQNESVSTNDNKTDKTVDDKTQKSESKPPNTSKAENRYKNPVLSKTNGSPKLSVNIRVRVISTFNVGESTVSAICPFTDTTILTHCYGRRRNLVVDYNGRRCGSLMLDFSVKEIIQIPDGLLALDAENKNITKLDMNGTQTQEIDIALVTPHRLCLCKDGSILVTMRETQKLSYRLNNSSRRYVARLTMKGRELNIYEYDNGRRLFTLPLSIDENINNDICVVNGITETSGNLVVIDNNGRLKFMYNRAPNSKQFDPLRVKCDRMGHIIITDNIGNRIHLLNIDGSFIQYLSSRKGPIIRHEPCTLTLDTNGYLWVGCTEGQVYVLKYLMES